MPRTEVKSAVPVSKPRGASHNYVNISRQRSQIRSLRSQSAAREEAATAETGAGVSFYIYFRLRQWAASVFGTDPSLSSLPFHDTGESAAAKTERRTNDVLPIPCESATSQNAAFAQVK